MGSFSVQVLLPDLISFCLKVFPNVIGKQKLDEITAVPISLPQTVPSSLSVICSNTGL